MRQAFGRGRIVLDLTEGEFYAVRLALCAVRLVEPPREKVARDDLAVFDLWKSEAARLHAQLDRD